MDNKELNVEILFDNSVSYEPSMSSCCCCCTAATSEAEDSE